MGFGGLKIESYKKGILFSSGFNFLSKLSQFLQSVAIAYYFGTQAKTDVFFYCYTTITLLALFINSLDASVLIPESMRLNTQENRIESIKFLNFFIYLYLFIGIVVTLVLYNAPVAILSTLSSFDTDILQQNLQIVLFSIPVFALTIITNLLSSILASYKFFTIPMIAGMLNNIISLLFLILFHKILDIPSLFVGLMFSYVLNILFLIYLMKSHLQWNFSFKLVKIKAKVLSNIFYAQAGNITSALVSYIPIYMLSGFNAGIITALNYGQKTAEMPNQLITNQFSSVVGIKFNELYAKGDSESLNRVFSSSTKLLLFALVPMSVLMFLYSNSIVTFLFKRGAFDAQSVVYSADFLKYFSLFLPMLVINTMVSRLLMAGQKIKQSFMYQIVFNLLLLLFIYIGVLKFGVVGYPIALVCLHSINVLLCYFLLHFLFPQISYSKIIVFFLKIICLNGLIFIVVFYLKSQLNYKHEIIEVAIGCLIYVIILLILNWYLKINSEINQAIVKIINFLRRDDKRNS